MHFSLNYFGSSYVGSIFAQHEPAEFSSGVNESMTSSGSSEYIVPTVLQPNPSLSGGHAKRLAKKQLPRCFFSYDRGTNTVSGAFLATRCFALSSDAPDLWWQVDRVVMLELPVKLECGSVQWSSTVLHLKADAERTLRLSTALIGGSINDHFTEVALSKWHCWPLTQDLHVCLSRHGGKPLLLKSDRSMARATSVSPEIVR